jgi:AP-1 complex subunit gamma-1
VISNLIALITQTPELHVYAVQKLFSAMSQDVMKQALVQLGVWCLGEFGDVLSSTTPTAEGDETLAPVSEKEALDLLERVIRHPTTTVVTKEIVLTALVKLSDRFKDAQESRFVLSPHLPNSLFLYLSLSRPNPLHFGVQSHSFTD